MDTALFNTEFNSIRPALKSFLFRLTASVMDAEDLAQDTYIKAHEKLTQFKGESTLKTWVFSIASNLWKDNLRAQKRWVEHVTDIAKQAALADKQFFQEALYIRHTSPQGHFEIKEHIAFCFSCISKTLSLEYQICLLLKEVYEFKLSEIAEIMNVTEAMVKYYLHAARAKMIDIFEGRCALINKNGVCHQCTELNGIFNPKQQAEVELRKIDLYNQKDNPDRAHLFDMRAHIVRDINPLDSAASALQTHHMEFNRRVMETIH